MGSTPASPITSDSPVTSEDLLILDRTVAKRSPGNLNYHDREDVAGDILVDAVAAAERTGIAIVKLAFTNAKRTRYYSRAGDQARERTIELLADPDGREEGPPGDAEANVFEDPASFADVVEIRDLIRRLPAEERQAFERCAVKDDTVQEASEDTGVPSSTMHDRMIRAQGKLQTAWLAAQTA